MHVPRRGEPEHNADAEPGRGRGHQRDAEERRDADPDLEQRDADPVTVGTCANRSSTGLSGLPRAKAWSCAPIDWGELESKNEGSASFWIPAYTKVTPRNPRSTTSASG